MTLCSGGTKRITLVAGPGTFEIRSFKGTLVPLLFSVPMYASYGNTYLIANSDRRIAITSPVTGPST